MSISAPSDLEQALNDFDPVVRREALVDLLARQPEPPPQKAIANLHCHTFFSFNALGLSPTGLAWLGRQQGIGLMGIVDFDVLDAVSEFLETSDLTGVRGSAGIETRTHIPEFMDREFNSPGEPGVLYHMAIGFTTTAIPPAAQTIIDELRSQSAQRNRSLVARVNTYLKPVEIDYETDVLPLTPAGNATERHIVVAYVRAAARELGDPAPFWAERLGIGLEQIRSLLADSPQFQNTVRSKLMKKGGPGYMQPGPDTFPPVQKVDELALLCGALPCPAWLDGLSTGEQAMDELLALLVARGAVALNLVPDRNWNLKDPAERALKLQKLYEVVDLARAYDLPLNIGTELNSFGQRVIDDFDAPALAPVRADFLDGAYFVYGHTVFQRWLGMGFQSEWAKTFLPERRGRNAFFTIAGKRTPPGAAGHRLLAAVRPDMTPDDVLEFLE
jgi:hypothetical protein